MDLSGLRDTTPEPCRSTTSTASERLGTTTVATLITTILWPRISRPQTGGFTRSWRALRRTVRVLLQAHPRDTPTRSVPTLKIRRSSQHQPSFRNFKPQALVGKFM